DALIAELTELEGERPNAKRLRLARTLFARAVETPGGLKIDTIHAFCERLLHLVPFEANVPARFTLLDESQSDELLVEEIGRVLARAMRDSDSALHAALGIVTVETSGDALTALLSAALRCKAFLHHPGGLQAGFARLRSELGLAPGENAATIERSIL
ncbi:double-strand break repair helicase AddA, partial [Corallococcus exiguus]|nr:double-strand break repair helicase AddA [Corallococcus exiguus]